MNKVTRTILLITLALVLLLSGCYTDSEPSGTQTEGQAPDFQLQNLDGQTVSLSDLRGKPVLLNFWATWCHWCGVEMPYLEQIYQERLNEGLEVLAIDVGESASEVRQYVQNNNLLLPVLLDTRQVVAQTYKVTGYPTTFFIDKDGIIQGKKVGAFLSKEEIEPYLSEIIP